MTISAAVRTPDRWEAPPTDHRLAPDQVHVWRTCMHVSASMRQTFLQILSPEERTRSERLRFARDRDHFVVARGVLRLLLGRYLDMNPIRLRFDHGPHGKPALAAELGPLPVRFNVSHSGGLALYALAFEREIGVDVERIRADPFRWDIAKRVFTSREQAAIGSFEEPSRAEAFFACWTLKEGYAKALGQGLALSLQSFDLSSVLTAGVGSVGSQGGRPQPQWFLQRLDPGEGYAAAMAVEGGPCELSCFQWCCPAL